MYPRIDYESGCSPGFGREPAVVSEEVFVEPHLLAKPLCVESPTFDESSVATVASELGKIGKFLLDCDLEVVARNCFVVRESLHHVLRTGLRLVGVDVEVSGSGTVFRRCIVVGSGCRICHPFLDFPEIILSLGKPAEKLGKSGVHSAKDLLESVEKFLARRVEIRLVLPKCIIVLPKAALELNLSQDHVNLSADACEFPFAQAVDLAGRETCRRVKADEVSVHCSTIWNGPDSRMSPGFRQVFFSDKFEELLVCGDDVVLYRFAHVSCDSVCSVSRNFRRDLVDRLVKFALVR